MTGSPVQKRVMVVGLNYAPDFIGIAKYTTELCEALALRGYEVSVVTAPPYYPDWKVPPAYRALWSKRIVNGVEVLRAPIYVPSAPTGLKRLLHLISFTVSAAPAALMMAVSKRPNLVLAIAPSLLSAPIALMAARLSGARSWLHIQDFEVDAAFELNLLKGRAARRWATAFERAMLRAFDTVSTISTAMRGRLLKKGVGDNNALEVRNWVDTDAVTRWASSATTLRAQLGVAPDSVVALYSGNMASKQGLESLAEVAALLDGGEREIVMLLCGQGPFRATLEKLCEGRGNVRFLDLQPIEKLDELLATADIHLLPQRAEAADLVLPSKLTGMLASGRPVVAMADDGTGLKGELFGCGVTISPGDARGMADALVDLAGDPDRREALGLASRERAERNWSKSAVLDQFERAAFETAH